MKRVLLLALFMGLFSFQQCTRCRCPEIEGDYFDVNGMVAQNMTGSRSALGDQDEIAADRFTGILLEFHVDYVSQNLFPLALPFTTEALACSCADNGYFGSKSEAIAAIYIKALTAINASTAAGDTVNALFETESFDGGWITLEELVAEGDTLYQPSMPLQLKTPLSSDTEVQFDVELHFTNGESYTARTRKVRLL